MFRFIADLLIPPRIFRGVGVEPVMALPVSPFHDAPLCDWGSTCWRCTALWATWGQV